MKKGRVVRVKLFNPVNIFKNDYGRTLLFLSFVLGLILGIVLFSKQANIYDISKIIMKKYLIIRTTDNIYSLIFSSFLMFVVIDFIFFVFGVSIIGIVFVPMLLCLLGYFTGSIFSYNYFTYSIKGIAFNSIILLPTWIVYVYTLISVSKTTLCFSKSISNLVLKSERHGNVNLKFSALIKKHLILLAISAVSALIDAIICRFTIDIFNF